VADNEINLSVKTDAKDALSTLKDVKDAFDLVGGTVGAIGSLAIEAAEKIKQLQTEVRQMREDFEQAAVSIGKTASALTNENLKLQDQIAILHGRPPANQLAIALMEASSRAQDLAASLRDALLKERELLENQSVGLLKSFVTGQAETTGVSKEFAPQIDSFVDLINQKEIAIAEFNLKNQALLEHGTAAQKKAVEKELQTLIAGYNAQLAAASNAVRARLDMVQSGLEEEKKAEVQKLVDATNPETGASLGITQADAEKAVTEEYRTRQSVINSLRLTILQLLQAGTAEAENIRLRVAAATTAQAKQAQIIEIQAQKNRIDTTRLGSQEVVADYEKSFTEINATTQRFNNQQLSILMTGINKTSTQVVLANQNTSKKIEADDAASLARRQKLWDQTFKGISGAFDTFINGLLSGQQKLSQAWEKLVESMVSKFVDGLEKQLMSFIEHKLMELTIHTSTEQAKDEASKAAHAKEDERTAYSAAKGAWESVVHTPIVGPILAPIAAATTFAAVSAFGSAEGGQYIVPSEQLTMLHRNEMVLPAVVADRMRGVIEGGGGGGTTVVVNHSVSAVDAESFQSHIRRHANLIGNEVARVLKKKSS
jgi:hypothetical protein